MTTATAKKPVTKAARTIPSLQFSSRQRLTDEQRDALRAAFNEKLAAAEPETTGRGGSIRVQTNRISNLEGELGMDRITFSSLIASRESHSVPVLLRLQRVLGVELVTEADFRASFDSYLEHLRREYW